VVAGWGVGHLLEKKKKERNEEKRRRKERKRKEKEKEKKGVMMEGCVDGRRINEGGEVAPTWGARGRWWSRWKKRKGKKERKEEIGKKIIIL